MEDDWNLSTEELDSLEQEAFRRVADRQKSTSTSATVNRPSVSTSSSNVYSPAKRTLPHSVELSSPLKRVPGMVSVRVYNDAHNKIAVETQYNKDLVSALKSIPGHEWDQNQRVWRFPEEQLSNIARTFNSLPNIVQSVHAVPPLNIPITLGVQVNQSECKKAFQSDCTSGKRPLRKQLFERVADGLEDSDSVQNIIKQDSESDNLATFHIRLFLHGSGKIAARFDYQPEVVTLFRSLPKSEWMAKERLWIFPISSLVHAENALKSVSTFKVYVESIDPFVRCAIEFASSLPNLNDTYINMPSWLESNLLPFQRDGVRFALEHGGRVLIADEMGLGKTLQGIAVSACLKECWPVLVIVPSALRLHWALMVQKWLRLNPSDIVVVMSQSAVAYRGSFNIVQASSKQMIHLDGVFNIISYDLVPKLQEILMDSHFNIVIADESHYLKNAQAKRTTACVPILQRAKHCILLTGTPALSRPIELYKQLEALYPNVYKDVHVYGQRYCRGGIFGMYQGASNHEELHALMKATVMIRRLKKDVLSQLPEKRREQIFLSLEERGLRQMKALFYELEGIRKQIKLCKSDEEAKGLKLSEKQLINKIYLDSAEAKVPAVLDYLGTVIEAGCKFLVFAHHLIMLDAIEQFVSKKKVGYIRIDGSTPAASRQAFVTQFQERDDVRVAVLSIRAAGLGLTLTAASTVIFSELSWTPGDLIQAEDRAHRIGQLSSVNVYYLHANETVDDIIWNAVQHKLDNIGQVLDGQQDALDAASKKHYNLSKRQMKLTDLLQPCSNSGNPTSRNDLEGEQENPEPSDDNSDHRMLKRLRC